MTAASIANRVKILNELVSRHCHQLKRPLPTILAVTKYASSDQTQAIIDSGLTLLGENKVQDGLAKQRICSPCTLHLIGHLQSNKVKKAVQHFDCIQSVDSLKTAELIHQASREIGKRMPIFLEVNIGEEGSKYGFSANDLLNAIDQIHSLPHLDVQGLMAIPPYDDQAEKTRPYFQKAHSLYQKIRAQHPQFSQLSMGMSHDFLIALEEGATMIRIGGFLIQ